MDRKNAVMTPEEEIIRKYANKAEEIYTNRTAGDWTWLGLMAEMTMALRNIPPTEED